MKSIILKIQNQVGLHARPASMVVQTAQKYESDISVTFDENTVDAKSLLGILGLGVSQGAEIFFEANGADETEAIEDIRILVESNFGER